MIELGCSTSVVDLFIYLFIYQELTAIPSRKNNEVCVPEVGMSEKGVCWKIILL